MFTQLSNSNVHSHTLVGCIFLLLVFTLTSVQVHADATSSVELGERIYRDGISANGNSVTAIGPGGLPITGNQTTCARCHGRSGYGSSEGSIITPSISGKTLYIAKEISHRELASTRRSGAGVRPAYTDTTLRRAILEGIGANGHSLGQLMPRFKLSNSDTDSLIAYLKVLGSKTVPGVTEEYFDFSTIITSGVSEADKKALLTLFQTYIDQINSETRHETRRSQNSPWHKAWHYKAYRKWRLHVWELTGDANSWNQQLTHYYQKQPVFAVINGLGKSWGIIHNFCEINEIPCLFPTTDLPGTTQPAFYSLYFSKGMFLDANLISNHIHQSNNQHADRIIQVYRGGDVRAIEASKQLKKSLISDNSIRIEDYTLTNDRTIDYTELYKILGVESPYYLVLWGDFPDLLKQIRNTDSINSASGIYLSTQFLAQGLKTNLPKEYDGIHLVHRFVLPEKQKQQLLRFSIWARVNKLTITNQQIMANAFFSLTTLAEAIRHIRNNISREYLIERIEHMVDNTVFHSVYPHLSLGPDQRYASKGGYIITYRNNTTTNSKDIKWLVP